MPLHHRHRAPGGVEVRAGHPGVQEHAVKRVHRVLGYLQPVAGVVDEVGHELDAREREGVEHRELGHVLRGAEVGEDESGELPSWIGAVAKLAGDGALGRLGGRLENGAVHVEQPAVVAAADAMLRDDSVLQRRAAVAAMLVQEADSAREIPKQHELLTEDLDENGPLTELLGHRHRGPVAPEILAARGAGPGVGQLRILACVRDAVVSVVAQCKLLGGRGHVSGPWMLDCRPAAANARFSPVRSSRGSLSHRRCAWTRFASPPVRPPVSATGSGSGTASCGHSRAPRRTGPAEPPPRSFPRP